MVNGRSWGKRVVALQNGQKAHIIQRRGEVVALKRAGLSERKIADVLHDKWGISYSQVRNDWKAALKEMSDAYSAEANQLRVIQNDRLLSMLTVWWPLMMRADTKATEMCLRVINLISEINGLKPEKPIYQQIDARTQVLVDGGGNNSAVDRLLARLSGQLTEGGGDTVDQGALGRDNGAGGTD